MKITFTRWAFACALASGAVGALLLPGSNDETPDLSYASYHANDRLWLRSRAVDAHERSLLSRYESALDVATAKRAFAAPGSPTESLAFWFAADVPEHARRRVTDLIAAERNARPDWRGHGPVGILVITDTATALRGVKLPPRFDRERPVTTSILPPSRETGGRCVTVVRLRHTALAAPPTIQGGRLPMDGCAFQDAFGPPGAWIAAWLASERFEFARRLALAQPAVEHDVQQYLWDQGGIASMQCRGGNDSMCVVAATKGTAWASAVTQYYNPEEAGTDRRVESMETLMRFDPIDEGLLEALARDLGPTRFQRVWRSPKPLADSYFDETGETLARWERTRLVQAYGPYRAGPAPSVDIVIVTVSVVALIALLSIQRAARPSLA